MEMASDVGAVHVHLTIECHCGTIYVSGRSWLSALSQRPDARDGVLAPSRQRSPQAGQGGGAGGAGGGAADGGAWPKTGLGRMPKRGRDRAGTAVSSQAPGASPPQRCGAIFAGRREWRVVQPQTGAREWLRGCSATSRPGAPGEPGVV
nr:PREDICTED: ly-6/neurotoxin-like protein 1 isoform X3 [Rhinolophus sinicus]